MSNSTNKEAPKIPSKKINRNFGRAIKRLGEEGKESDSFGMMVRDFTAMGFMAKSEARRRFNAIIKSERQAERKNVIEIIKKMTKDVGGFIVSDGKGVITTVEKGKEIYKLTIKDILEKLKEGELI